MKLEVDYNGARYRTNAIDANTVPLTTIHTKEFSLRVLSSQNSSIANARVNLRRSNNGYVAYTKTNTQGIAAFQVVPNAQMKLQLDYNGDTYTTPTTIVTQDTQLEVKTNIFGIVLTDSQGNPIKDARINLRRSNNGYVTYTRTNAEGKAAFEVVPGAEMKLEVDYNGARYTTQTYTIGEDTYVPMQLPVTVEVPVETGAFALKLIDSQGNPIKGARINLRKPNNGYVKYKKTDANGIASFETLPESEMKFEVNYHGASYYTPTMDTATHPLTTVQTKPFAAKLLDYNSNPIAHARVNLRKSNNGYVMYTRTGTDGIASFEVLPGAQMKLEADYNGARYTTGVLDCDTTPLTTIQTNAFRIKLIDSQDNPIQGARINLRRSNNGYVKYKRTDANGIAAFNTLPDAQMKLEVDYHGTRYMTGTIDTNAGQLTTIQTQAFAMKLLSSDNQPVSNARVNLRRSNDGYVMYARTNTQGIASFEVLPNAQMKLEADYHGARYRTDVIDTNTVPLTTLHTQAFAMKLLSSDNQPVSNARVNLRRSNDGYVMYARTNTQGIASFEVLPNAQMKLEADYHGARYRTDVIDTNTVPLTTIHTLAYSVLFTDSTDQPIANARFNLRRSNDGYVMYQRTNANGIASFEVLPNAQMKLEADYHGARYKTSTNTVTNSLQIELQAVPLNVHLLAGTSDLTNQRVNLRRSNNGYVMYQRTNTNGETTFQVLPQAQQRVESTYNGVNWNSGIITAPTTVTHAF